jgi:hypothetical protein
MAYLSRGADGDEALVASYHPVIELIQWVVPDLSRLDWREWAMYQLAPGGEVVFWSVTMAFAYIVSASRRGQPAVLEARVFLMHRSLTPIARPGRSALGLVYGLAQQRLSRLPRHDGSPNC